MLTTLSHSHHTGRRVGNRSLSQHRRCLSQVAAEACLPQAAARLSRAILWGPTATAAVSQRRRQRLRLVSAAMGESAKVCDAYMQRAKTADPGIKFQGVHHVAIICADLERSMDFYCGLLGLEVNPARPHDNLPYRGAWLWTGPEMIHLMELPNPDPTGGRPEHGGRDRHACFGVAEVAPLEAALRARGVAVTASKSGRPAIFFRDPDGNTLECVEVPPWRPGLGSESAGGRAQPQ